MKWFFHGIAPLTLYVAPLAGAWIEIEVKVEPAEAKEVAPLAGAWIEIFSVFP